jgi:hypothetical protein
MIYSLTLLPFLLVRFELSNLKKWRKSNIHGRSIHPREKHERKENPNYFILINCGAWSFRKRKKPPRSGPSRCRTLGLGPRQSGLEWRDILGST